VIAPVAAAAPGHIAVEAGNVLSGAGVLMGTVTDNGAIDAAGGLLKFTGSAGGSGTALIDPSAVLFAAGSLTIKHVVFADGVKEKLKLGTPLGVTSTIRDFGLGSQHVIDLVKVAATSASFSGGVLTVRGASGVDARLHFASNYSSANFALASDHHGGTNILFHVT
jgi:hypothetical protein